mgnify:CR=1 FL=1
MQIEGQIIDIIYKNEINSYTVATFETAENEAITVVGYLPFINNGDNLRLTGDIVTHPEYGEQLKIATFEKVIPSTPEALEKYLANSNFKGIGPATAKKIVKTFGKDTINIIKLEPQKLTQIKGINKAKALEIAQQFLENWELWQIVGFLDKFGIGPQNAENVYKKLGESALEKIEENPYILIDVASKVNFEKVDKIALDLGFEQDNYKRIRSGIKYGLEKIGLNGHSAVIYENLVQFEQELLRIDVNAIEETIIGMKAKEEIIIEERDDQKEWVYAKPFYIAEKNIAEKITTLRDSENTKRIKTIKKELEKIEKEIGLSLSEKQKEAIFSVNDNNVCVITGGPGTGKTTIIKGIVELYKQINKLTNEGLFKDAILLAPTGRAARRITEATNFRAITIHKFLKWDKETDTFQINKYNKSDVKLVIIDESSMIDMFLFNSLLEGLTDDVKLILVGDYNQLPSVLPGDILKDLIDSDVIPVVKLNELYRQKEDSYIINLANDIKEGIIKNDFTNKKSDYNFIEAKKEQIELVIKELCKIGLDKGYNYHQLQVLVPMYRGVNGIDNLNNKLQEIFNPKSDNKDEFEFNDVIFREGDKVLQTKNLNDLEISNGDIGVIDSITKTNNNVKAIINFDGIIVEFNKKNFEDLKLGYAISIHKAQGSEFDVVIMPMDTSFKRMLYRKLIYTGITRAKKSLTLVGEKEAFIYGTSKLMEERNTLLKEMLINSITF